MPIRKSKIIRESFERNNKLKTTYCLFRCPSARFRDVAPRCSKMRIITVHQFGHLPNVLSFLLPLKKSHLVVDRSWISRCRLNTIAGDIIETVSQFHTTSPSVCPSVWTNEEIIELLGSTRTDFCRNLEDAMSMKFKITFHPQFYRNFHCLTNLWTRTSDEVWETQAQYSSFELRMVTGIPQSTFIRH